MEIPIGSSDLLEMLGRIEGAAAALEPQIEVRPNSAADIFAGHEFTRASRLFRAALVLLRQGMPAEALVLARPIVETLLRFRQMAAADDNGREAIALGWEYEGTNRIEWLGENAGRIGLPTEEWIGQRDRVRNRIREYESALGVKRVKPQDPRPFSQESGAEEILRNFFELQVLHQFTHGSRAMRGFFESVDEAGQASIGRVNNPSDLSLIAGVQLADAFGTIVRLTSELFGIEVPTDIEEALASLRLMSEEGREET